MAGLLPFGHTFRSWMGNPTLTSPKQTNVDSHGHVFMGSKRSIEALQDVGSGSHSHHSIRRQPGIRERTDESSDLPRSNDIMQHIAESCRNRPVTHIGTDGRRLSSFGSSIAHQAPPSDMAAAQDPDPYDAIEAEIDQLKEDVAFLRMESDQGRSGPKTEQELAIDRFLSARSKKSLRNNGTAGEESAATRLQRPHEVRQTQGTISSWNEQTPQLPPSPLDFPVLALSNSGSNVTTPNVTEDVQRKLSYANVATNGMMEAIDQAFSPAGKRRSDSKVSGTQSTEQPSTSDRTGVSTVSQVQTGSTSATGDSHESRDEEHSVIITPTHDSYAPVAEAGSKMSKHDQSSGNKDAMKQSPRFAQPTKSFARRTGEALRRDAASTSPKSPVDGSPGRTIKTKELNLATAKRAPQKQQKRTSLPGDWIAPPGLHCNTSTAEVAVKSGNTLIAGSAPSTTSRLPGPTRTTHIKPSTAVVREKESQHRSPPRKKTSSYMAPTSAATQRTMATLGENKPKVERMQTKAAEPRIDTTHANQYEVLRQRSSTMLSDNSSVQFILDSPVLELGNKIYKYCLAADDEDKNTGVQSQMRPTSPSVPKSPPALTLRASVPRSSTRGPKARPHVASTSRIQTSIADLKASQHVSSFPVVANTTTKRRTSNSNVLTPIVARLESEGILNKASQKNGVIRAFLQNNYANGNALHAACESSPGVHQQGPKKPSESLKTIPSPKRIPEAKRKVVPPHLRPRSRDVSTTSTATETAPLPAQSLHGTPSSRLPGDNSGSPFGDVQDSSRRPSATQSLRATAKEFKPGQSGNRDRISFDRRWSTDYIPDAEWLMLPQETKMEIMNERNRLRGPHWQSDGLPSLRLPLGPASSFITNAALNNLIAQRGLNTALMNFVDENGSPNAIPFDQLLKPNIIPRKKTVQWTLQDCDGNDTPAEFGRAPAPDATSIFDPSTPTISLSSDDTSPLKRPHSIRGSWHIGSTLSHSPYGWTGGDGKEIKFIGYGPYAERDPNSVVNFNFQGRTSSFGAAAIPNGYYEDKENFSTDNVAPRSQRQWAEKLGYHKVPCGNVEITHAVEHIPFGKELANYCHDCMAR